MSQDATLQSKFILLSLCTPSHPYPIRGRRPKPPGQLQNTPTFPLTSTRRVFPPNPTEPQHLRHVVPRYPSSTLYSNIKS
ncbi:uncharacterized protein BDR25DRAFT_391921 [Lindgomyces ingoldianus]|uniref:Uncharacterized protein n=1 Tax=Lindgomyces ingoldianus TaxID=673940 RepID=A0ACB6R442_9PLEO|nr:uncharacterized protein BDR25DRAFT_391921 [Lindgomyces ingoldianus]KAF2474063.1 hypothetical protein BDR25DRAFT_391921 [Lindgomyces ingoldianus]